MGEEDVDDRVERRLFATVHCYIGYFQLLFGTAVAPLAVVASGATVTRTEMAGVYSQLHTE